jgi:hypothetical protein
MADYSRERSEIENEIRRLSRQQSEANLDATFLGKFSLEQTAEYEKRRERIDELRRRLVSLDDAGLGAAGR